MTRTTTREPDYDVVLADNPSPLTGRGTQTYILGGRDNVVVIDPGPRIVEHVRRVAEAAHARGTVSMVLLTHHHSDHTEGAVELARMVDAPLAGIPHRQGPRVDRVLRDGETIPLEGRELRVVATPGHARDHLCFLLPPDASGGGSVFVGDLVAGEGYIVIAPPDGNMADYINSLRKIAALDVERLLPAHGPAIENPRSYLEMYISHRLEREEKVINALKKRPGLGAIRLLATVYSDTPKTMWPLARMSLRAHIEKLIDEGRVVKDGRRYLLA